MRLLALQSIGKLYFSYEELAAALGISAASARVSANRYTKLGLLIRVRRNLYVPAEQWRHLTTEERFILANVAMSPSYISLQTALEYYGITTQLQQNVVESLALLRTKEITVAGQTFRYTRIQPGLLSGFTRPQGFFIASPEKAFLDTLYLSSLGRYSFDRSAIDVSRLDRDQLARLAELYSPAVRRMVATYE